MEVRHEHTTSDTTNVEILRYTYDNMERMTTTYQSKNNIDQGYFPSIEGLSTQNAQAYGWSLMSKHSNTYSESHNLWKTLTNFFKKLF